VHVYCVAYIQTISNCVPHYNTITTILLYIM